MLASFIGDPAAITSAQMDRWSFCPEIETRLSGSDAVVIEVLRADGSPYRARETDLIKALSAAPRGQVPGQ